MCRSHRRLSRIHASSRPCTIRLGTSGAGSPADAPEMRIRPASGGWTRPASRVAPIAPFETSCLELWAAAGAGLLAARRVALAYPTSRAKRMRKPNASASCFSGGGTVPCVSTGAGQASPAGPATTGHTTGRDRGTRHRIAGHLYPPYLLRSASAPTDLLCSTRSNHRATATFANSESIPTRAPT